MANKYICVHILCTRKCNAKACYIIIITKKSSYKDNNYEQFFNICDNNANSLKYFSNLKK